MEAQNDDSQRGFSSSTPIFSTSLKMKAKRKWKTVVFNSTNNLFSSSPPNVPYDDKRMSKSTDTTPDLTEHSRKDHKDMREPYQFGDLSRNLARKGRNIRRSTTDLEINSEDIGRRLGEGKKNIKKIVVQPGKVIAAAHVKRGLNRDRPVDSEDCGLRKKRLLIRVIRGISLKSRSEESCNAYLRARGVEMKWKKTKVEKRTNDPKWGELIEVEVLQVVCIQVFDRTLLKDEFVGSVSINVQGNKLDVSAPYPLKGIETVQTFTLLGQGQSRGQVELGLTPIDVFSTGEDFIEEANENGGRGALSWVEEERPSRRNTTGFSPPSSFFSEHEIAMFKKEKKPKKSRKKKNKDFGFYSASTGLDKKRAQQKRKDISRSRSINGRKHRKRSKRLSVPPPLENTPYAAFMTSHPSIGSVDIKSIFSCFYRYCARTKTTDPSAEYEVYIRKKTGLVLVSCDARLLHFLLDSLPFFARRSATSTDDIVLQALVANETFCKGLAQRVWPLVCEHGKAAQSGRLSFSEFIIGMEKISSFTAEEKLAARVAVLRNDSIPESNLREIILMKVMFVETQICSHMKRKSDEMKLLGLDDDQISAICVDVIRQCNFEEFTENLLGFLLSSLRPFAVEDSESPQYNYEQWIREGSRTFFEEEMKSIAELQQRASQILRGILTEIL
eukprot:TRINITY_DN11562_c0_g1_i1.p1 TRINITY_DN11562_c0_g1~~TRINITY_DN11562_c0_g1_i1.p1  ORF type:complete len:713 (-),score=124.64 TRINITY_DN11562_c0_g1_i1:125-2137(-)